MRSVRRRGDAKRGEEEAKQVHRSGEGFMIPRAYLFALVCFKAKPLSG